ncbi:MAG: hypothetical protein AAF141_08020 [Pseudomonadota bacterium]
MFDVSKKGAWEEWVAFYLEIVSQACDETIAKARQLVALNEKFREAAHSAGQSANLLRLADFLFVSPVLSISDAAGALDMTFAGAQRVVLQLIKAGLLMEIPDTSNPKYYAAPEIIQLIQS